MCGCAIEFRVIGSAVLLCCVVYAEVASYSAATAASPNAHALDGNMP